MRLDVDLTSLWSKVHEMGAQKLEIDLGQVWDDEVGEIDRELSGAGIDINLEDVESVEGLLNYRGRQVLLFIPDHGGRIDTALEDPVKGNRFHIADCEKLDEMRRRNRFERYKVTNNVSGVFEIYGISRFTKQQLEGEAALNVCKFCLNKLNFKGADNTTVAGRNEIVKNFSLEEFFSTYSSLFKHYPKGHIKDAKKGYTSDWKEVSRNIRARCDYVCAHCHVSCSSHKNLLHVHHINGDKSDNGESNLKPLCADCHRKEPYHEHMYVKHSDVQLINRLRREQNLIDTKGWDSVYRYADPACQGVLSHCQKHGYSPPEVGYEVVNDIGEVIAEFELAWANRNFAVVLERLEPVEGWSVLSLEEAIDFFSGKNRR